MRLNAEKGKMLSDVVKFLLLWCISAVACIPHRQGRSDAVDSSFIGKGTNEIATSLLQGTVAKEEDMVFSPFGYSAIMAIFSEGARGISKQEIATALHFPDNPEIVREAYQKVLERFVGRKNFNAPEFKNWFYIYKNYSVKEDFQNILRKYYLTEVKHVKRPEEYLKEPLRTTEKPEIMKEEKLETEKISQSKLETYKKSSEDNKESEPEIEKIKLSESKEKNMRSEADDMMTNGEGSSVQESMNNQEKSDLQEPMKNQEKSDLQEPMKNQEKSDPQEPMNNQEKSDPQEPMNNQEKSDLQESMNNQEKSDMTSEMLEMQMEKMESEKAETHSEIKPVSKDNFSGMTDSYIKVKGTDERPQMIIFNGLYYRGQWDQPFERRPAHDSRPFYKSETEKVFVSTIHSQGVYNTGIISGLDCKAIELPYKGNRYSLLILVPNTRNGLTKLIADLSGYSISSIYDQLTEKLTDVCLPSFEINTISKPISSLQKLGLSNVTSIFNPQTADLSGISDVSSGLYIQELVQMVTFKVEAEFSKTNFLTAATATSRSNAQVFQINQPFLFYLRDNLEDIIIINGKIIDPTPKPNFYFS